MSEDVQFWEEIQRARHMELEAVRKRRQGEINNDTYWLAIVRARRLEVAAIERYQLKFDDLAA